MGRSKGQFIFVSRTLHGAEIRYQKIEKLALALVTTARKLRPYFQTHQVIVRTNQPIRQVLQKPDLAGRMMNWSVELSEFGVAYEPRGAIKAQALSDFVAELSPNQSALTNLVWILSVDGSSNMKGSGAGIVLEGPQEVLVEQSLRFEFRTSNNQAEYEAIITGMKLVVEMAVPEILVKSDSQLVINQIQGEYQTKDEMLLKYLS